MKNVVVFFGGNSVEHDISIITAIQVCSSLNDEKYKVIPVYISKNGEWYSFKQLLNVADFNNCELKSKNIVCFKNGFLEYKCLCNRRKIKVDCAIIAMHGGFGEDGSVAGCCNLNSIPFVNPGLEASSVGLNKILFKTLLKGLEIPYVKYCNLNKQSDVYNIDLYYEITEVLGDKIIIKPNRLGSSIGVSIVDDYDSYVNALSLGFNFENDLLIEKRLTNFNEYNIAIYKNLEGLVVSEIEQPLNYNSILTFEDKYIGDAKTKGSMESLKKIFPANINDKLRNEIIQYSKLCYEKLFMKGVVRFDFIFDNNEKVLFLNEVNTIPGSFANYLFRSNNISFSKMLDEMIDYAVYEHDLDFKLVKSFDSSVLNAEFNNLKK